MKKIIMQSESATFLVQDQLLNDSVEIEKIVASLERKIAKFDRARHGGEVMKAQPVGMEFNADAADDVSRVFT